MFILFKRFLVFIVIAVVASTPALGMSVQELAEYLEKNPLTLELYVKAALDQHPLLGRSLAEYNESIEGSLTSESVHDWSLFIGSSYQSGVSLFGSYFGDTSVTSLETEVSRKFSSTGTQLSFQASYEGSQNLPEIYGVSELYTLPVSITLRQPLWRNGFGLIDRYPLVRAEFQRTLAGLKVQDDLEDLVVSLVDDYFLWIQNYLDVQYNTEKVKKAQHQVAILEKKFNRGASEKIDLVQSRLQLSSKRLELLRAKQLFRQKSIAVLEFLNINDFLDAGTLTPSTKDFIFTYPQKNEGVDYFVSSSNVSRMMSVIEDIELTAVDENKENLKQNLDLVYTHSRYPQGESMEELGDSLTDDPTHYVGVEFSTTIGTGKKHRLNESYFHYQKTLKSHEDTMKDLRIQLLSLYDQISDIDLLLKEYETLVTSSKEYELLEQEKYNQGRSDSLFFLLSAQDQTLTTELALQKLRIEKQRVINQISGLLDLYVQRFNLDEVAGL